MRSILALLVLAFASPAVASPGDECSSDFSCSSGEVCVKAFGRMTGTCGYSVDRNGFRNYLPGKSLDSIGPNLDEGKDCRFRGCPIGYRCSQGVCTKW